MDTNLQYPHRRYDPLRGRWVLVSPHRTQRPWQGEVSRTDAKPALRYDPDCYLCPGNTRAGGKQNPPYNSVFAFTNDYAALLPDSPAIAETGNPLLRAEAERGICRVLCFHPDHSLTLAGMQVPDIVRVVEAWTKEFKELGARPEIRHVQIFENRGAMMGASNPHPHGQIWATEHIPDEAAAEVANQNAYLRQQNACLLCDTLKVELEQNQRIVCQNEEFVALVPFWAVWPFETLVVSRRPVSALDELNDEERTALAEILRQATIRYDNLFRTSFPYTMGFHQRPTDGSPYPEFHLHAHFYPPLLRSATIKKFMVGYEMLGMPQRDITAETAAQRLRDAPAKHFLDLQAE
jgi:UDPglucose--hexose-1-phosphate uridylyltransferase